MVNKLFFSYCHADEALRDQLEVHLAALKHQGLISTWHDRRIAPGDAFENSISAELNETNIILLLISPDFIASSYCYGIETQRALERNNTKEARVIPVVLRPCDWHDLPFGKLLALPKNGKPITQWPNRDEAFLDVVRGIKGTLTDLGLNSSSEPEPQGEMKSNIPSANDSLSGPRSSNLRVAKTFTDQDKDDFIHEAFTFIANFFKNSLEELSERNPDIAGTFRQISENRFTATVYRNGNKISACTIYLGQNYGSGEIRFVQGEQDDSHSWNISLSVDHDDQVLFLNLLGMLGFGGEQDQKLTMQGGGELLWGMLIGPLQQ